MLQGASVYKISIHILDDDDFDDDPSPEPQNHRIIGRCKVVYDYQPEQPDDLVLQSGITLLLNCRNFILFKASISKKKSSYCHGQIIVIFVAVVIVVVWQIFNVLVHHVKLQLQDKGHNSECYIYGIMPLFN